MVHVKVHNNAPGRAPARHGSAPSSGGHPGAPRHDRPHARLPAHARGTEVSRLDSDLQCCHLGLETLSNAPPLLYHIHPQPSSSPAPHGAHGSCWTEHGAGLHPATHASAQATYAGNISF